MWKAVFGNDTAGPVLACLAAKESLHASAIARECGLAFTPVLNQLDRFEDAGLLGSRMVGRNRVFQMRKDSPLFEPVIQILALERKGLRKGQKGNGKRKVTVRLGKQNRDSGSRRTAQPPELEEAIVEGDGFLG